MQQQTGKPARLPDRCPQHPYSRTVITSTKGAITADGLLTLTQHRCGEPGCNQGTGWIYVGPGQASRSGSGACEGQELLDGMAQAAHEHLANAAYAMIVVMTAFAIAGTWDVPELQPGPPLVPEPHRRRADPAGGHRGPDLGDQAGTAGQGTPTNSRIRMTERMIWDPCW